jgi:hypothetical protein
MKKGSKRVRVERLRGLALYNYIFKQVSETNKRLGDRQQLGQEGKRKKASIVYKKYKRQGKFTATEIREDIKKSLDGLPPIEICNPLYLSAFQLQDIEYYQIDDQLRNVLPDCLDVKINAGSLGYTKIFNTRNYNYYTNNVKRIVENIRQNLQENTSGQAIFNGVVRLRNGMPNDGSAESYYVEFFLYINDEAFEGREQSPVEYNIGKTEETKKQKIAKTLSKRVQSLKQRKRRERAKKGRVSGAKEKELILKRELNKKIAAVKREENKLKKLFLAGVITKAVYNAEMRSLELRREEIRNRYKSK